MLDVCSLHFSQLDWIFTILLCVESRQSKGTQNRFQEFKLTNKCLLGSVAGDSFLWNKKVFVKFPPSIPNKTGLSLPSVFMRFFI